MADNCPTCGSPDPARHPATSADGGEVQPCPDPFHPPLTPELDKQSRIIQSGKNQVIGDFLDWLEERGLIIARYHDDEACFEGCPGIIAAGEGKLELVAGFFEIDLDKIEQERRALLEHLRARQ